MTLATNPTTAIAPQAPLNALPLEVAEQIKAIAWAAAWHTANTRAGYRDAETDMLNYQQACRNLDAAAKGLNLSPNTLNLIKGFAMDAGWHCANTRKGYKTDATNDLVRATAKYVSLFQSGEISQPLAANLTQLCWAAGWYCANTRVGHIDDAKADESRFNYYFNQICGSVTFVAINFLIDKLKMLNSKPVAVVNETLINRHPSIPQQMSVKVSTTKGYTKEWSHNVGFKVSSTATVKAGFEVVEVSRDLTFEASYGYTWGGSETTMQTNEFEYPVTVGPLEQVSVKGMAQEVEMTVPYELIYKIGEVERRTQGVWHGVACSSATMEVSTPTRVV